MVMDAARPRERDFDWATGSSNRDSGASPVTGASHALAFHQLRILLLLAERHGEVVDRQELRELGWPGQPATDDELRDGMRELRGAAR